jgi:hypothetical protein
MLDRTFERDPRRIVENNMRALMRQFGMDSRFESVDAWLDFVMGPSERERSPDRR